MEPIDMHELLARGPRNKLEELRIELYTKVNALGIGAQGLGGLSTVLDVKIQQFPTHAASKPVAMIPNCAATRHVHFVLDGSGAAELEPPSLDDWPKITWTPTAQARRVDLDRLTREEVMTWKPGDILLLNGKLLTGRDAAHKRIQDMLEKGEKLPVDFTNRVIYYVGPVDPVRDEAVGPAGPTTATRMDKFTETMLGKTGLIAMIGKGERGPAAIEGITEAPGGVADRRRRGRLSGGESHPEVARSRLRRPRDGSDLRVRGEGHAGRRRGGCDRKLGAPDRSRRVGEADPRVQDPGGGSLSQDTGAPSSKRSSGSSSPYVDGG